MKIPTNCGEFWVSTHTTHNCGELSIELKKITYLSLVHSGGSIAFSTLVIKLMDLGIHRVVPLSSFVYQKMTKQMDEK